MAAFKNDRFPIRRQPYLNIHHCVIVHEPFCWKKKKKSLSAAEFCVGLTELLVWTNIAI